MRCSIERAVLCGYDWGGRAACIVAALWPERVRGLVTCGGYNMHDVAGSAKPASAEQEHRYWYQYYFCTERGRAGLTRKPPRHREAAVEALVAELDVRRRDVRGDRGLVRQSGFRRGGDPLLPRALRLCAGRSGARGRSKQKLAAKPTISVPTIVLQGEAPGTVPPEASVGACKAFHRAVPAPHDPARRPQRAAGSAARDRGGGAGAGAATG